MIIYKVDRHVVIFRYFLSNINSPVQYLLTQIDLVEFHRIIFKFSLKFAGYARRIQQNFEGEFRDHTRFNYWMGETSHSRRLPPKRELLTLKLSIGPFFEFIAHHRPTLDPRIIS